ncbi:MAG: YdbL family protein [Acidobacteria bacterium]|nr:YdbL family protein [Acidobacteriota bacterium]
MPAYAADVAEPAVSNPAIRKIIDSRAARVAELNGFKAKGVIGEGNDGLVVARGLESLADLKARAAVQKLVRDENKDREALYREIAAATNVDASQIKKVQETYAATLRESAKPGEWIQMPDGAWKQK